jgi:hypothetical protein
MKTRNLLPLLAASALLLPSSHLFAQDAPAPQPADQMIGVSHPEKLNDTITTTDDPAAQPQQYQKPSPAVPAAASAPAPVQSDDHYVPYSGNQNNGNQTPTLQTHNYGSAGTPDHYAPSGSGTAAFNPNDPNSGVVTSVPLGPNDLPIGTRLVAQLNNTISTKTTAAGTRFTAELTQPVMRNGRVILPVGTVVNGRISQIHGGRRISGASAIRLTPDDIILPDRSTYRVLAEVVDLDHFAASHVNNEGVITDTRSNKVAAGATALTTTSGLVAGAMIAGPIGAGVGAGVGAGIGAYWWLREDRQQTLPTGTEIVFSLDDILTVSLAPDNATYVPPAPSL